MSLLHRCIHSNGFTTRLNVFRLLPLTTPQAHHPLPRRNRKKANMLAAERVVPSIFNMWKKDQLCDANVRTSDSLVRAHRVVLAAFSDRLLYGFLKEEEECGNIKTLSSINMEEYSSPVLNQVIRFCHTGEIVLTKENIEETLMCCRRLDIKILLDRCIDFLNDFNLQNCLDYYCICERCELLTMSDRIRDFICRNFAALSTTKSFLTCEAPLLIKILSDDALSVPSELVILEAALAWLEAQVDLSEDAAQDVIKCVRLGLIHPEDIIQIVEPRMRNLADYQENASGALFQAMAYHGLNKTDSTLTSQFASRPRTGTRRELDDVDEASSACDSTLLESQPRTVLKRELGEATQAPYMYGNMAPGATAYGNVMSDAAPYGSVTRDAAAFGNVIRDAQNLEFQAQNMFPLGDMLPQTDNDDCESDYEVQSVSVTSGGNRKGLEVKLVLQETKPPGAGKQVQANAEMFPDSASDMTGAESAGGTSANAAQKVTEGVSFDPRMFGGAIFNLLRQTGGAPVNPQMFGPVDPRMVPGGQFDPRMLAGGQFDPRMLAGGQFDPRMLAGGQFDPRMLAGGQFDPRMFAGGQFDPRMFAGGPYDPRMFVGGPYDPRMAANVPGAVPVDPTLTGGVPPTGTPGDTLDATAAAGGTQNIVLLSKPTIYLTGGIEMNRRFSREGLCILKTSPQLDKWSVCSKINCDTHHHTAVIMEGEIYITGGFMFDTEDPSDYGRATDEVSVYNPPNNRWTKVATLLDTRAHHGAVVYGKKIYVVCGVNHQKKALESVEEYDPRENKWSEVCNLPSGRLGAAIALCRTSIYMVGGYNKHLEFPILDEVLCLDLSTFSFVRVKPFAMPICHAALACIRNELYLVGGRTVLIEKSGEELLWHTRSSDVILKFNTTEEEWDPIQHMQVARHDASVAVAGTALVIIGGMCSPTKISLDSVECFDVEERTFNDSFPALPAALSGASSVCLYS